MRRSLGIALVALLLVTGCRSKPAPPEATPPPAPEPNPAVVGQPSVSTPETPPPAPAVQLPITPPQVSLSPAQVLQGDVTVLRFDRAVPGDLSLTVTGLWEQPKPFLLAGLPVAFIGFPANAKPGIYPVKATWADGSWEGQVEVVLKHFTEDRLVVTEEQEEVYNDPRQQEEWNRVYRLRSTSEDRPLWRGAFQVPLAGELMITTYFGEIRFVNGVETGRHSGMDFGAPTGTPILAPARGKVILAEPLIVSGNTIIIDHGMNLFTAYYHCERLDVAPGDWVQPGQAIGQVGSTGFSTGPHLHWTATIGNIPVDPWPLTEGAVLGVDQLPPPGPVFQKE